MNNFSQGKWNAVLLKHMFSAGLPYKPRPEAHRFPMEPAIAQTGGSDSEVFGFILMVDALESGQYYVISLYVIN